MKLLPEKVGGENISIFFDSTFADSAVATPVAGEARGAQCHYAPLQLRPIIAQLDVKDFPLE